MLKIIDETVEFLKNKKFDSAEVGIILGTGLGKLIDEIEIIQEVSYNQIPNFPTATVEFHKGKLIYGIIEGKKTIVMQGRFHVYEGYSQKDVTYPIRIMGALGVKTLLVSNASGAINLKFKKSELMLIDDHINLQGGSPLAFKGVEQLGERFVDMSVPYDKEINGALIKIEKEKELAEKLIVKTDNFSRIIIETPKIVPNGVELQKVDYVKNDSVVFYEGYALTDYDLNLF